MAEALGVPLDELWDHVGFIPVPAGPGGQPASVAGTMSYGIFRQAAQPGLAVRLLERALAPEALARIARVTGRIPARRSAIALVAPDLPFLSQTADLMERRGDPAGDPAVSARLGTASGHARGSAHRAGSSAAAAARRTATWSVRSPGSQSWTRRRSVRGGGRLTLRRNPEKRVSSQCRPVVEAIDKAPELFDIRAWQMEPGEQASVADLRLDSAGRGTHRDEGQGARSAGDRSARRELDGPCHPGLRAPLSASVELGLRVHLDRIRRLEPVARAGRAPLACSRASGHDGLLPHIRFAEDARYFPGPSSGRRTARRAHRRSRRPRASCSRRCTQRRSGTCTGRRRDGDRGEGVPARAPAEARRLARVPLPGARPRRRRPRRDLAPVGVRHGQLTALGRRPRPDLAGARGDPGLRARRPGVRRRGPAADERRVRPLRVPGQALPGLWLRLGTRSATGARSSSRTSCSTRSSSRRTATSPRSPASWARIRSEFEAWAEQTAEGLDAKLWDEREGSYGDYDVRAGERVRAQTAGRLLPALRGHPDRGARTAAEGASDGRPGRRRRRSGEWSTSVATERRELRSRSCTGAGRCGR